MRAPTLRPLPTLAVGLTLLAVAACSGGAPASPAPDGTAALPSSAPVAPSADPAAPTTAPVASADVPPVGGGSGDWCHLTNDEVGAAMQVEVATSQSTDVEGLGGGCMYSAADGTIVFASSTVTSGDVRATAEAGALQEGAETMSGMGDYAVLVSTQGPLVIVRGSSLISMGALGIPLMEDPAAYKAALESLGQAVAGRLP